MLKHVIRRRPLAIDAVGRCGVLSLIALAALMSPGCEGRPPSPSRTPPSDPNARVALPSQKLSYTFAPSLVEKHPEATTFLRHFLETCLSGDYEGYRRLVARGVEPEGRARFERVLQSMKSIDVMSIEPIALSKEQGEALRIVGRVELAADPRQRRRTETGPRRMALLVVKEGGEWRVAMAPRELQPEDDPEAESAPTTTGPAYPWDAEPGEG